MWLAECAKIAKNLLVLQDICGQQLYFHKRNATHLISISGCLEHML